MNRLALLALFVCVAAAGVTAYAADTLSADEQAIAKIEHEWNEASKNKNAAFFEKNFSKDFTYINERGEFSSGPKAYIDQMMNATVVEYTATDEKIRVHGSTAVATGRWSAKDGKGGGSTTRYTDTYAKGPEGWKAIASQETPTK